MTRVDALVSQSSGQTPQPGSYEMREMRADDVLIDVAYCGICHSDIHQVASDWGRGNFPMVPGHEITGIVAAVGSEVTRFAVGDRAGIGVLVNSCGECEYCKAGTEQYCPRSVGTYGAVDYDGAITYGGYARQAIARERFVAVIPAGLPLDAAAPLLCAGVTVYSPLRHWGAGPGVSVAVVGMGGLGHMAVKFAKALGCDRVSVLSHSAAKRDDAIAFGADDFIVTSEPGAFKAARNSYDLVINTVSAQLNLKDYLGTLRVGGTMCTVGLPDAPASVGVFDLTARRLALTGSNIGSMAEIEEMLELCADKGILATIETVAADHIAEAFDRVRDSDVRYRFVIDAATIPASDG